MGLKSKGSVAAPQRLRAEAAWEKAGLTCTSLGFEIACVPDTMHKGSRRQNQSVWTQNPDP